MVATEAMLGYGSKYEIFDPTATPTPIFVVIGEVFNVTPPSYTAARVEATHMQSPNSTREYIPGLLEPGAASFEMNFIPGSASDILLQELQTTLTVSEHRITFPNNVTWTYDGAIESYAPDAPTDDRMTATVDVLVAGTFTAGTAV